MVNLQLALPILLAAMLSAAAAAQDAGPRPPLPKGPILSDYPPEAVRKEQEGRVGYQLTIDESGKVTSCVVKSSSHHRLLDEAACRTAMRQTFEPALDAEGKPTTGTYGSTAVYNLH